MRTYHTYILTIRSFLLAILLIVYTHYCSAAVHVWFCFCIRNQNAPSLWPCRLRFCFVYTINQKCFNAAAAVMYLVQCTSSSACDTTPSERKATHALLLSRLRAVVVFVQFTHTDTSKCNCTLYLVSGINSSAEVMLLCNLLHTADPLPYTATVTNALMQQEETFVRALSELQKAVTPAYVKNFMPQGILGLRWNHRIKRSSWAVGSSGGHGSWEAEARDS